MRFKFRFLLPLFAVLLCVAYLALPVIDRMTLRWFVRDVNLRVH